jgi:hypothetical protein
MHGCSNNSSSDKCDREIVKSEQTYLHQTGLKDTETTEGHNKAPTSLGASRSLVNDHDDSTPNPVARRRQADERIDENEIAKWRRLDRS